MKKIKTTLMTVKFMLIAFLAIFSTQNISAQNQAQGNESVSKEFKVCAFNVDGLPKSIDFLGQSIQVNPDGLGEEGAQAIGEYIAQSNVNFWALSEDFSYHHALVEKLSENFQIGSYRGAFTSENYNANISFDTDGLEFIAKSPFSFSQESWTKWNQANGKFSNGFDEMINKGYRHYVANLGDGVFVDFYIMHMDAETTEADNAARASQWEQLRDAILSNKSNHPIIVMGDTNSRYTRDDIKGLFINPINEAGNYEVKDAWIEKCKEGNYPALGDDALMVDGENGLGYEQGEIVDKVLYLSPKANGLTLSAVSFEVDKDFAKSDHKPVIVTLKVEGSTYAAAEANNWWSGEEAIGNGQEVYIYNVGAGTFISGEKAIVKNINNAYTWNMNGNSPYTFACNNDSKDRIHMQKSFLSWSTGIQKGSGASNLTLITGTTPQRGNAYKLSVTANKETRYFNVDGDSYTAAKTSGVFNDWLFISVAQKEAYQEYVNLFNNARDYSQKTLPEDLKAELDAVLEKTQKGSYSSYSIADESEKTDKALLEGIIAKIKTYLETPSGISNIQPANPANEAIAIYNTQGVRMNKMSKGINIIKMSDGTTKKVWVK